jgi:hypothetical protein
MPLAPIVAASFCALDGNPRGTKDIAESGIGFKKNRI